MSYVFCLKEQSLLPLLLSSVKTKELFRVSQVYSLLCFSMSHTVPYFLVQSQVNRLVPWD